MNKGGVMLRAGCALGAILIGAMPAMAQQAGSDSPPAEAVPGLAVSTQASGDTVAPTQDAPKPEEIVVVGSQIKGSKVTAALPVTVIDANAIAATGAVSGDDLLRAIPQMGDVSFNASNNAQTSNSARGDVNSINLRNLGVGNTLVLLNGRRMVQHPVSQAGEGNVPVLGYNSNALPVAGIDRLEVLRDGAAAIYGADAVAGVVNTVTRTNYNGASFDARYGYAEGTSRREYQFTGFAGHNFADNRGNVSLLLDYTRRTAQQNADEPYTATADLRSYFADNPDYAGNTAADGRATYSPWANLALVGAGRIRDSRGNTYTSTAGAFHTQSIGSPGCVFTINAQTCLGSGTRSTGSTLRNERYDTAIGTTAVPGVKRFNSMLTGHYDLTDTLTAYTEIGYYRATSQAVQPAVINLNAITIPASNYWNPFGPTRFADGTVNPNRIPGLVGVPAAGLPVTLSTYRYVDAGVQHVDVTNWQSRFLGGLKGKFFLGFDFDSAFLYSEAKAVDRSDAINSTKLQQSLALSTPDAYNPFSGGCAATPSSGDCTASSQAALDAISFKLRRASKTTLTLGDFKLSNAHLLRLPAGDVGLALGVEGRHESQEDDRDPNLNGTIQFTDSVTGVVNPSNVTAVSPTPSTKGDRTVFSAFGELAIPVVSPDMHIPLVRQIDVQLAGRYEHYSDFGSVAKPKVAAAWDVVDGIRFRGSYSKGFRAPNLEQVNTVQYARLGSNNDYYRCEAALRAGRIPTFNSCTSSVGYSILIAGNPNLKPENSTNWTAGVVLQPKFIPSRFGRLTLTADFWSIHQVGIVGQFGAANAIVLDYLLRQQGSSNPNVIRTTPNADDEATFTGTGLAPAGQITQIRDQFVNLLPQTVQGLDLAMLYNVKDTGIGDFDLSLNGARLTKYSRQNPASVQALFDARASGAINPATPLTDQGNLLEQNGKPKWRVTAALTWSLGNVQVGGFANYIGKFYDTDFLDAAGNAYEVKGQTTFNLYAQYSFKDGILGGRTRMRIGVRNLTNKAPPFTADGYLGSLYNAYRRYWYMTVGTRF